MNYQDSVRYLLTLGSELAAPRQPAAPGSSRAQKFDLRNITTLAKHLGEPQRAYPCAHIAGTNGKGSTAAMLASICVQAGMKTGLYTSPHLERINERIRMGRTGTLASPPNAKTGQTGVSVPLEEISDADFAATFTRLLALIEKLLASGELAAHPTYFECLTAMAFDYFAGNCGAEKAGPSPPSGGLGMTDKKEAVDFAVLEVGMGGRLDATNIVEPQVCIITQIDFDHENYLGHSIEQIAAEKAGIIKPGVPVVCAAGRAEARAVIARRCGELGAPMIDVPLAFRLEQIETRDGCYSANVIEQATDCRVRIDLPLAGRYQLTNAVTAVAAARVLRQDEDAIQHGIAGVQWPGRLELLQRSPAVYLDGTHNPAGARELLAFWDQHFPGRRIHLIYGAVRDKAVDEIAGLLFPRAHHVILTAPRQARAISAEALAEMTAHFARSSEVLADPQAAVERALETAAPRDAIFMTGSLYLVGDVRRWWRARQTAQSAARAV